MSRHFPAAAVALANGAWLVQVRDAIRATADGRMLDDLVAALRQAAADPVPRRAGDAAVAAGVGRIARRLGLAEAEAEAVLQRFLAGGEPTRFGLSAAITGAANDLASYDRASRLEEAGGKLIALPRARWAAAFTSGETTDGAVAHRTARAA